MTPAFCAAADELDLIPNWITPFLSVAPDSVPSLSALRRWLQPFQRNSGPLIVQLLGHGPETLAETARRLAELGVPGINLNFACPSKTVIASGNGGALLRDPERMNRIVHSVMEAVAGRASLSLKLRSGWETPAEMEIFLPGLSCVPWIVLHYRTVREQYVPVERNEALCRIAKSVSLCGPGCRVFGNGDIVSPADAERMICETACAGIAVGRALFSNPFLIRKIRSGDSSPVSDSERKTLLLALLHAGQAQGRVNRGWLIECVRMVYGGNSEFFHKASRMTEAELIPFLSEP